MKLRLTTSFRRIRYVVCGLLAVALFALLPVAHGLAATTAKGGITVSPAIVNLALPSGQQEASSTITLANTYDKTVRLSADWQSIDEATGRLIPSGPLNPALANSLRISETDISISPQTSKQIRVVVQNNPNLAPGGHYAILVFTVLSSGKEKLGLQSALSVTVFVIKRDGAKTSISLNDILAVHNLFTLPSKARLTITNTGNVHVVPRAAITIERKHDVIAKAIVNQASSPLLPGKKATYDVRFTQYKRIYWASRLQLRTVYRVDQSGEIQERTSHFWYIPPFWPILILSIGGIMYLVARKSSAIIKKLRGRIKHRSNKSEVETTQIINKDNTSVAGLSKIAVSSVEISPSHIVPVEHATVSNKKAKKSKK